MATRNPGSAVVPYQEPTETVSTPPRETDKPSDTTKRWIFPVFLLVAVIVTWVVLYAIGMAGGAFGKLSFPLKLCVIVTIFHIVILAWPTVLLVRKRAWPRLIVVAVMVAGIWLTLLFGYIIVVGEALWGLRFLGVLALVSSATAAYALTRYAKVDQELTHEVSSLPGLNETITDQKKKANQSKALAKQAQDQVSASETALSDAVSVAEASSRAFTKAQKAFKDSDLVKEKASIEADLAKAGVARNAIPDRQAEIETALGKVKQRNEQSAALESKFQALNDEYTQLTTTTIPDLEQKLAQVNAKIEVSDEKRRLDQAAAKNETDSRAAAIARSDHKQSSKRSRKMNEDWKLQEGALAKLTEQRDDVVRKQQVVEEMRRLQWRDEIALALFFAVLALLCYPSWYGWVALEVF